MEDQVNRRPATLVITPEFKIALFVVTSITLASFALLIIIYFSSNGILTKVQQDVFEIIKYAFFTGFGALIGLFTGKMS